MSVPFKRLKLNKRQRRLLVAWLKKMGEKYHFNALANKGKKKLRNPGSITQRVVRNARRRGVKVYTRKGWGTVHPLIYQIRRKTKEHLLLPEQPSDTLVQHITVTFDSGTLVGDFKKDMRTVERIGYERFGSGVSYNWCVDMQTGEVGLGQSLDAAGTHTINDKEIPGFSENQNYVALAIAMLGMPGDRPTRRAVNSLVNLIAAHIDERALTLEHDYLPHSEFTWKDCPTQPVRDLMAAINSKAKFAVTK